MAAGAAKEEDEEDRSTPHAQDSPASCIRRLPHASSFDACPWLVPCSLPRILDAHGPLHLYAACAKGPESTPALIEWTSRLYVSTCARVRYAPRNKLLSPLSCFQKSGEGREHRKEKDENVERIAKRNSREQLRETIHQTFSFLQVWILLGPRFFHQHRNSQKGKKNHKSA